MFRIVSCAPWVAPSLLAGLLNSTRLARTLSLPLCELRLNVACGGTLDCCVGAASSASANGTGLHATRYIVAWRCAYEKQQNRYQQQQQSMAVLGLHLSGCMLGMCATGECTKFGLSVAPGRLGKYCLQFGLSILSLVRPLVDGSQSAVS